jgi:hypothetical protein
LGPKGGGCTQVWLYIKILQVKFSCSFAGQDGKRERQNIQINLKLTQLCLRGRDLKAQFEEIMNPIWLSLKIPPGYTEIVSKNLKEQNENKKREKNKQAIEKPSDNFTKYGTKFSRENLMKYNLTLAGNN